MTNLDDLIGLTEMAKLLDLTKSQANAFRQKPGFPTPKKKFAMGPVWDAREVMQYAGREGAHKIPLFGGTMVASIRNRGCMMCDSLNIRVRPGDGELEIRPDGSTWIQFVYDCDTCKSGPVEANMELKKEEA